LDADAYAQIGPEKVFGLIFLFKWKASKDERPTVEAMDHGLFFANQVIPNACATQAILSVLMNLPSDKKLVDIGQSLKEFKEFTASLGADMKGLAIENSEQVRRAHNSFRQHSSFEVTQDDDSKGEDAFHFVAYINHENRIYELDGLKKGPILIGDVPAGTPWVHKATEEVQRRVQEYSEKAASGEGGELRFQLMATTVNRQLEAETAIERQRFLRQRANISLVSHGEEVTLLDEVDDDDAPTDIPSFDELSIKPIDELKSLVQTCTSTMDELQAVVDAEKKKRQQWAKENARRRHDLVPLVLCAMRHLARRRELMAACEKGKAATLKRAEEKKATASA
jgi:ubiquitin carboxyl-terminal hydrolase L5